MAPPVSSSPLSTSYDLGFAPLEPNLSLDESSKILSELTKFNGSSLAEASKFVLDTFDVVITADTFNLLYPNKFDVKGFPISWRETLQSIFDKGYLDATIKILQSNIKFKRKVEYKDTYEQQLKNLLKSPEYLNKHPVLIRGHLWDQLSLAITNEKILELLNPRSPLSQKAPSSPCPTIPIIHTSLPDWPNPKLLITLQNAPSYPTEREVPPSPQTFDELCAAIEIDE